MTKRASEKERRAANASRGLPRRQGTCLACRVSRLLLTSRRPSRRRARAFRHGRRPLNGQSVHTLTNDSRHSRATPPRRAILGGVLAHAAGVLHFGRSYFLPVHTDRLSDTWKVSKGTSLLSLRGRGWMGVEEYRERAPHAKPSTSCTPAIKQSAICVWIIADNKPDYCNKYNLTRNAPPFKRRLLGRDNAN